MGFYYPQDVTDDMGPTAVLPGSQYYDTHESAHSQPDMSLCGEAGTVTIVHYDLWHRATPNQSGKKRYMLKFLFLRLDGPTTPDWQSDACDWHTVVNGSDSNHPELWETQWDWYHGKQNGTANGVSSAEVESLVKTLQNEDEKLRLNASYRLGRVGAEALPALNQVLRGSSESIRNYAGYALSIIGEPAVPTLIDRLQDTDESIRTTAAYALADIGKSAQEAVPALTVAANDESPWVRRNAMEGLGIIGQQVCEEVDFGPTVKV